MNHTLSDRRHLYLMDPKGEPLLPGTITHDRRRRKVVEDLLEAMRTRARAAEAIQALHDQAKSHAPVRRRFWHAVAIIVITFILIALIAQWADHRTDIVSQVLGAGALYGWLGFHRVALSLP